MSYEAYEQPMVEATIYYYNKAEFASAEFCDRLMLVLEKYGYFDVTSIEISKNKVINGLLKDSIIRYNLKQISNLNIESELKKWISDKDITSISFICKKKGQLLWYLTWYKDYDLPDGTSISKYAFNHLDIDSSYERLNTIESQEAYLGLFYELSCIFDSFYGNIEDISTWVDIMDSTKEKCFNEHRIQAVYWGNFLGRKLCSDIGILRLDSIPCENRKCNDNGFFFWLSNDISDSKDNPNFKLRKKIYKHLLKSRF